MIEALLENRAKEKKQPHPNSLKNLKGMRGEAGPGRPKKTPEERAVMAFYKTYLENGGAVEDLKKLMAKGDYPTLLAAIKNAEARVYGKPKEHVELSGSLTLAQIRADLLGQETKE